MITTATFITTLDHIFLAVVFLTAGAILGFIFGKKHSTASIAQAVTLIKADIAKDAKAAADAVKKVL